MSRTWAGCVFVGVSLDGYLARPDGDLTWLTDLPPGPHAAATTPHPALAWETFLPGVDTVLMGRATYRAAAGFDHWPYPGKRVVVLSTTLAAGARVQVVRSVDDARELLDRVGARRVYVDGGRTIQAFLAAGLVDELTVAFAPVLLGRGVRLFGDLDHDVRLTVRGQHATPDGLVRVTYDVATPAT